MKKAILVLSALMLLAGCGGAHTVDLSNNNNGHAQKYDPYNPIQNHDPSKNDKVVTDNHNSTPGEGLETFDNPTEVRVLDLPGSPVWIKDKYFNVLFGASDKVGGKKLLEMLNKEKVEQLDCVYIPSTNPETFEGLLQLIGKIHIAKIGSIGGSVDLKAITEVMKLAKDNMVLTENQVAGSKWKLNQMLFEILYPMSADISTEDDTPNTCVVCISKGDWSAILTGEMTEEIGTKLVQRNKLSPTTVLIATNGAPKGSFGSDFLDAVKAERLIAGKRSVDAGSGVMANNSVKTSGTITIIVSGKKPNQQ